MRKRPMISPCVVRISSAMIHGNIDAPAAHLPGELFRSPGGVVVADHGEDALCLPGPENRFHGDEEVTGTGGMDMHVEEDGLVPCRPRGPADEGAIPPRPFCHIPIFSESSELMRASTRALSR